MSQGTTRRRLLRTTAAGTLSSLLAACSRTAGESQGEQAAASLPPARVTVMFPGGGSEDDDFKPVFEAFAQRYPRITAEWTPGATGGYNDAYTEKLVSLFASSTGPDVFKTLGGSFGQFAQSGVYRPLDDYVKKQAADVKLDDFFPPHVEGGRYKGKLYSLPHDGAPQGVWINADLFQREGLAFPSWDTTWSDFLNLGIRLTKRDGDQATQLGFGRPGWLYWLWSAGGDLYTADGTKLLIDQPASIEALTWLQEAVHKYRVCPNPQEQADSSLSAFPNGRIAMVFGVRGSLGTFRDIQSFSFDAAPIPKGPKGRVSQLAIGYTSIWTGSKVPDAAFVVLNWICSAEGQRLKISRGFAHPSRKSLVEEDWYKNYRAPRSFSDRINTVFPDTLKRGEARTSTPHPHEADIMRVANAKLAELWSNAKSPREVAQAIVAEASQYLVTA